MEFFRNENLWLYLPLILWISGIFYLSSNEGSISNTARFLGPVFNILFPNTDLIILKNYHRYLRKFCHFIGYGILALFAAIPFYNSSIELIADYWYFSAFFLVLMIASADEIKQSFYASRIGSVSDVMLDCAGGLMMILVLWTAF